VTPLPLVRCRWCDGVVALLPHMGCCFHGDAAAFGAAGPRGAVSAAAVALLRLDDRCCRGVWPFVAVVDAVDVRTTAMGLSWPGAVAVDGYRGVLLSLLPRLGCCFRGVEAAVVVRRGGTACYRRDGGSVNDLCVALLTLRSFAVRLADRCAVSARDDRCRPALLSLSLLWLVGIVV
jgi:hypothetical protein